MYKNYAKYILIISALFLGACSSSGTGILDYNSSFSTDSGNPTLVQIGGKIITACSVKGWRPRMLSPGHIDATRRSRGYVANVDIYYTMDNFQIKYKDSDNMDYTGSSISSTYNTWVNQLSDEIKRRLSEL